RPGDQRRDGAGQSPGPFPGHPEHRPQRPAGGGSAAGRSADRRAPKRRPRGALRHRQRLRDHQGEPLAHLRPVLHHQAARLRYGPWPFHRPGAGDRPAGDRTRRERAWPRNDRGHLAASGERMNRVGAVVDSALRNAWVFEELPWNLQVDPERARFPEESFFAAGLRPFRAMNTSQRRAFVFRETCFHLSNLLVGERSGEQLVAQVLVLTARDQPWHREFLAVMAQEEAKHFLALQRYLSEKAGVLSPGCRGRWRIWSSKASAPASPRCSPSPSGASSACPCGRCANTPWTASSVRGCCTGTGRWCRISSSGADFPPRAFAAGWVTGW